MWSEKNSGIDAHLMSGLWDLYKNMYENRNVYLYFTDFIMYHMTVIFTSFSAQTLKKIRCNQLKVFLKLQQCKYPTPWYLLLGDCTLICGVYNKECSLVVTLYCVTRQTQDTYPIRTSDQKTPHNQHQGRLLLTEAEMEQVQFIDALHQN